MRTLWKTRKLNKNTRVASSKSSDTCQSASSKKQYEDEEYKDNDQSDQEDQDIHGSPAKTCDHTSPVRTRDQGSSKTQDIIQIHDI